MGLKDQLEAIRWVSRNVEAFGGDADKITLYGESAGGMSVHFHLLSPLGEGLYHGGIAQSGTALSYSLGLHHRDADEQSERFMKDIGCAAYDSYSELQCLQVPIGKAPVLLSLL